MFSFCWCIVVSYTHILTNILHTIALLGLVLRKRIKTGDLGIQLNYVIDGERRLLLNWWDYDYKKL